MIAAYSPRLAARNFALPGRCAWITVLLIGLAGCGGGSGNSGGGGGILPSSSTVTGTTTDLSGNPIVQAAVQLGNLSAASTQFGTYSLPNVVVPTGQTSLLTTITASTTINGRAWSGQNTVELLSGDTFTPNINLVLSETSTQGALAGTVRDEQNRPLIGARVFASYGPFPVSQNAQRLRFDNLSAFVAVTDQNGSYKIPALPPASQYTVTASFAGKINQSLTAAVNAGQQTPVSFTLNAPSANSTVPVVQNLSALVITTPTVATRAAGQGTNERALNAIRWFLLKSRGLLGHRVADTRRVVVKRNGTRDTPIGSILEADLFWDYQQIDNLYGYAILRSDNTDTAFRSIALLRDPQADRFADVDTALTPGLNYYYSVARLDTINFPANGTEGSPANPPVVVQPLPALTLASPNSGTTVAGTPTFSWTAVQNAALYQILIYDRFPDLQSDTDPNGTPPIWPTNPSQPGSSLVSAPATSQVYQGPRLISGHTYYWAVLAQDRVGSAYSISPIQTFFVP